MNCLKESFRSLEVVKNVEIQNECDPLGSMPWLCLYRVRGQSIYKEEGFSDRGVVSLREGPS